MRSSRIGECMKTARAYPYTCDACCALVHGKTSVSNWRLQRNVFKHQCSDMNVHLNEE